MTPDPTGLVIPTYREAESLPLLHAALRAALEKTHPDAWLVVVDDSPDEATADAARALADPHLHLIRRTGKGGRGSAVFEGLSWLHERRCERFVELDADLSHPPEELPALLEASRSRGVDLLIASRHVPGASLGDWPLRRRVFSRLANGLARRALGVEVRDCTNGYRVYSRRAVEALLRAGPPRASGFIALSEGLACLHAAGLLVDERPTCFRDRRHGDSSVGARELTAALWGLARVAWRHRTNRARA